MQESIQEFTHSLYIQNPCNKQSAQFYKINVKENCYKVKNSATTFKIPFVLSTLISGNRSLSRENPRWRTEDAVCISGSGVTDVAESIPLFSRLNRAEVATAIIHFCMLCFIRSVWLFSDGLGDDLRRNKSAGSGKIVYTYVPDVFCR